MPSIDELNSLLQEAKTKLAAATDEAGLRQVEIEYLGRQDGKLTQLLRGLADVPLEQRKIIGQRANEVKSALMAFLASRRQALGSSNVPLVDLTQPGTVPSEGHRHLVTQAIEEIAEIFTRIGFQRSYHPEVDWEHYAFAALNMPENHPARDEWETFFIDTEPLGKLGRRVLTPHTSNGQVREMEQQKQPMRMVNIGTCYRRQIDVSHTPMFHQFEGLLIDEGVTMSNLIGTLDYFVKAFYGPERKIRVRPFHFQFTEPSIEIDVSCGVCHGTGLLRQGFGGQACRMCKQGWVELGGAGMVHPNVLKAGKIDPKKYSGFAFGWGVERCFLMKAGLEIPDIRMLYSNDLRFLQQF
ncbi:MAG: phenylalanine--tRNA ligase subunit alpha [Patescibacteria group bacterium]|nr:phenylalanine--tRNA ligase subunit alpha [Patescibacteria group bacterium]